MKSIRSLVRCLVLLTLIAGCGGGSSNNSGNPGKKDMVPRGARLLEIHINDPADGDFPGSFNAAQAVGMDSASISLDWSAVDIGTDFNTDPATPIYATDPDTDYLAIANGCYPNSNTKVSLLLRPITTLTRMVPPGFENTPFDDPAMIDRFNMFLDHMFAKIPDLELNALAIGSEVDLHLYDPDEQQRYRAFYEQVSAYARLAYAHRYPQKAPLSVAVEVTHNGLLEPATSAYYRQLNATSDVIGVSYYPLDNGLVRDPGVVARDFADLLALYPGKNLHFFQLGYPSGYYSTTPYAEYAAGEVTPIIDSSELLQAQFIEAVFQAWDTHADRIGVIGFTWLNDETQAGVVNITANPAFGGTTDPAPDLVEFLRTLGLRTEEAADKPAWVRLAGEARSRGWTDTGHQLFCN